MGYKDIDKRIEAVSIKLLTIFFLFSIGLISLLVLGVKLCWNP